MGIKQYYYHGTPSAMVNFAGNVLLPGWNGLVCFAGLVWCSYLFGCVLFGCHGEYAKDVFRLLFLLWGICNCKLDASFSCYALVSTCIGLVLFVSSLLVGGIWWNQLLLECQCLGGLGDIDSNDQCLGGLGDISCLKPLYALAGVLLVFGRKWLMVLVWLELYLTKGIHTIKNPCFADMCLLFVVLGWFLGLPCFATAVVLPMVCCSCCVSYGTSTANVLAAVMDFGINSLLNFQILLVILLLLIFGCAVCGYKGCSSMVCCQVRDAKQALLPPVQYSRSKGVELLGFAVNVAIILPIDIWVAVVLLPNAKCQYSRCLSTY
ncbi:hypothetical protein U1Q18_027106 [Sarracenia purpurea var. burkii]